MAKTQSGLRIQIPTNVFFRVVGKNDPQKKKMIKHIVSFEGWFLDDSLVQMYNSLKKNTVNIATFDQKYKIFSNCKILQCLVIKSPDPH